ncbi:MAG: D-tyrosyl-tRNA(Tyr) deacylase [Acidobacteria bacterium]|nr:MAG: D-tyrosyl-tRNA(Tyr) deacylase [Acidobacteriota bacterium]GIK78102.1 MAG: D-aminoacyl-tRNA deacylase [Actinomycetes bacterium]
MRALVQRVGSASVRAGVETVGAIGPGMLVFLGVASEDTEDVARRLARKLAALRIFPDGEGRMAEPVGERGILCVSQFTLYGDVGKGNRPSFTGAAPPDRARPLYELVCALLGAERGEFGAAMEVELVNDGPVTLLVEVRP